MSDWLNVQTGVSNEFLLQDRIQKIQQIVGKYGEDKFCISYSGGKDSNVLSKLVDLALPDNKIPRVYADTGIELNAVRDFVIQMCEKDSRFERITPTVPIKQMLERDGYPFKSKRHCHNIDIYQRLGMTKTNIMYLDLDPDKHWSTWKRCPKVLQYQFSEDFKLRLSNKCCDRLKKEPVKKWQRERDKPYTMIGVTRDEKGQRESAVCLVFRNGRFKAFQPLVAVPKEWEDWFIEEYDIRLPLVYYPPFNFTRTGCKGCPFNIKLQDELDILEEYFPAERKQCEYIWKPVYDEYRRIGYRLKENS